VNCYQSRFASLRGDSEQPMMKMDHTTDEFSRRLKTTGHQLHDDQMSILSDTSFKTTAARKRAQTSDVAYLPTRKSLRLAGNDT